MENLKDKLKIMEEKVRSLNIYLIVFPEEENREEATCEKIMVENFLYMKKNELLKQKSTLSSE